jgi:adhesin transport system outer membrane protein
VSFNTWAKQKAASDLVDNMPDPQRDNDATWTKMEVSPDLPPRVAILGEDLIGVVTKQLPAERAKRLAMPYDEFKLRVRDAVLAFPDVGAAQSQLGFAQAGATESRAPLLPQINGFTESGKRSVGSDSYLGTPAYSRDGTNYGLSVRQVLFDFGAALFGFQSGKAKERAAQELLNSKRSEQALKTVASVIDLERARAQMNLATDNASSRLAIVKLVRERYEVGGGSKPDIIRAEARYAEALATVTNAQNRLKAAEAAYREAFAANPIGIIRGPNFEVPVEKLNASAEELAGTYPGLQQLAKLRDAAGAEAKSAFAKTLPSFNLAYDNIINGVSAPLAPSRTTNLLLQLKYNFYTGGAETARKDQADFKAKQAEQEFQSGLRQYERVLTQNQEDVRNSDALLAARKVAATSAISSMRAVREQFAFNKGTLLDLLTVQEGLFNAGRDLVDAEADRQISRYRYLHLTSGLDRLFDLSDAAYDVRSEALSKAPSKAPSEVRK